MPLLNTYLNIPPKISTPAPTRPTRPLPLIFVLTLITEHNIHFMSIVLFQEARIAATTTATIPAAGHI